MIANTTKAATLLLLGAMIGTGCGGSARLPRDAVALVTPLSLGPPPIYALIGFREDLELTSEQVAALDQIAQQLEEENRPLVDELQGTADRTRTGGQIVVRSEGEALLLRIRENQKRAVEAVQAVLVEKQLEEVCRLYDDEGEREAPDRSEAGRDTAVENRLVRPVGWVWCSEERPEPAPELRAGSN